MERKEFKQKYPMLSSFLLTFIIQSYEEVSDDEAISDYPLEYFRKEAKEVLQEAMDVLKLNPFPKNAIELTSMSWFETEEETKSWLKSIIVKLEQKIKEVDMR